MKSMECGKIEPAGGKAWKQTLTLRQGIDKDQGKTINRLIKSSGLKLSSQYMDEKIRITGKKIDDLQAIYKQLRGHDEVKVDLQMENMKS